MKAPKKPRPTSTREVLGKALGVSGRQASRVVKKWREENPMTKEGKRRRGNLRDRVERAKAEKLELENDIKRGLFVRWADVDAALGKFIPETIAELRRDLEGELPATLVGRSPAEIQAKLREALDKALGRLNAAARELKP